MSEKRGLLQRVLGEPLLHFAVLGALVFVIADATEDEPRDDAAVIRVERAVEERIEASLAKTLERAPTPAELDAAVESWVDAEMLYREGLTMGLDRDDPMVRKRVIQKMEFVGTNLDVPEEPDEQTLRAFLAEHADRYGSNMRHDFTLVTLPRDPADTDDSKARAALAQLEDGADPKSVEGRHSRGKGLTRANLAGTYGPEIANGVTKLAVGTWGMVMLHNGWALFRHDAQRPDEVPSFEKVRNRLRVDWKSYQRSNARRELLDDLRGRYRIERPG
ncbi:MAG: peptidylprolyl isomerase [Myxococcota bacterium]